MNKDQVEMAKFLLIDLHPLKDVPLYEAFPWLLFWVKPLLNLIGCLCCCFRKKDNKTDQLKESLFSSIAERGMTPEARKLKRLQEMT